MNLVALVNPGLEQQASREVTELISAKPKSFPGFLRFPVKGKEDLFRLLYHTQALKRLIILIGEYAEPAEISAHTFPWTDYFFPDCSFTVQIKNVPEDVSSPEIAQQFSTTIRTFLQEKYQLTTRLDFKKPDVVLVGYYYQGTYLFGLDPWGGELSKRSYRLFTHPGVFQGDLAYFFIRTSGFQPGERLLVGFTKDGTLAIEAALYAQQVPVRSTDTMVPFHLFPSFSAEEFKTFVKKGPTISHHQSAIVFAFDDSNHHLISARKNIKLAGVSEGIALSKYDLEELEVKYDHHSFDRLIFHIARREEKHIQEVFYQAGLLLKKTGTLLIISRPGFTYVVPEEWKVQEQTTIAKGQNNYAYTLVKRK